MTFFDNFHSIELIAAHRGYRAAYPENTFSAFQASIGRCHFIELDVQMSKDLVPVVFHDPTLERTSNAKAVRQLLGIKSLNVNDWNIEQLRMLDVGSWFYQTDPFNTLSNGISPEKRLSSSLPEKIMTLEEVLLHPVLRKIPINVEIKNQKGLKQHKTVAETVVDLVNRTGSTARVLISSFNHDYLVIAKTFAPKISLGVLQDSSHPSDLVEYLRSIGAAAYHPSNAIVDDRLFKELRPAGIGVNVYTVNSRERQKQLFRMGATAIFTDFPDLF